MEYLDLAGGSETLPYAPYGTWAVAFIIRSTLRPYMPDAFKALNELLANS